MVTQSAAARGGGRCGGGGAVVARRRGGNSGGAAAMVAVPVVEAVNAAVSASTGRLTSAGPPTISLFSCLGIDLGLDFRGWYRTPPPHTHTRAQRMG